MHWRVTSLSIWRDWAVSKNVDGWSERKRASNRGVFWRYEMHENGCFGWNLIQVFFAQIHGVRPQGLLGPHGFQVVQWGQLPGVGVLPSIRPFGVAPKCLGLAEIELFIRRVFPKTSRCFLSLECSLANGPLFPRPTPPLATSLSSRSQGPNEPCQGPLGRVRRPPPPTHLAATPPVEFAQIMICAN